ncbi:hypothetical protein Ddye_018112 [Dipteronia dyeriana]|uniref:Uncharacterized protein n=1 Tax=Dipteronia dyeriana TaxID=168575 RepID=A0AAD9UAH5_9ROSI|nr:hypothetical protein Ddye_018112 [Dipteronia dyeriana]
MLKCKRSQTFDQTRKTVAACVGQSLAMAVLSAHHVRQKMILDRWQQNNRKVAQSISEQLCASNALIHDFLRTVEFHNLEWGVCSTIFNPNFIAQTTPNKKQYQRSKILFDSHTDFNRYTSRWMWMMAKPFKYLIPMLITVLQVSSQGHSESPFKSHPANMWISLVATFIYYFAVAAAQLESAIFFERSIIVAAISGSLSAVSLVSMFLLPGLLGFLIFIPWTFIPIIVAYQIHHVLIRRACRRFQQKIKNFVSKLSDVCGTTFGFNGSSSNEQPRPPV